MADSALAEAESNCYVGRMVTTIQDITQAVRRLEQAAYERGWNDALASILDAAKKGMPSQETAAPALPFEPATSHQTTGGPRTIDVILDVVNQAPGLRGAEIFREVARRIPGSNPKVLDRTGRTALRRLRERGLVSQRANKKWYPEHKEKAEEL